MWFKVSILGSCNEDDDVREVILPTQHKRKVVQNDN